MSSEQLASFQLHMLIFIKYIAAGKIVPTGVIALLEDIHDSDEDAYLPPPSTVTVPLPSLCPSADTPLDYQQSSYLYGGKIRHGRAGDGENNSMSLMRQSSCHRIIPIRRGQLA